MRDATVELLEAVFSMLSLPRCYKQDKSRVSKGVNTEVEGSTVLEAVTRQRVVKIQQTEEI
jgi:hypothetical protein